MARSLFNLSPLANAGATRFARVILERGIDDPEGLTYSIPESMGDVRVGQGVVAPLGRADRGVRGYVVEIVPSPGMDPERIKPLSGRTGAAFPSSLLTLARWMAGYYCCPVGMVLSSMMPAAVKKGTGSVRKTLLRRVDGFQLEGGGGLGPKAREFAARVAGLDASVFPIGARELALRLGVRTVAPINRMVKAGLLAPMQRDVIRAAGREWGGGIGETTARPEPTAEQRSAIDAVSAALGSFAPFVLFGVTGSGKTEVYLNVLERVLGRGECAIVLVPEISLTPQTAGRFIGRFAEVGVAVLHSGLSASQRHEAWRRAAEGKARIVVGARSAVFAPFDAARGTKLGAIIVDEEHDHSYKQDQLPRYHARDVAIKRAQIEGCPVVLGSATPSLESWWNCLSEMKRSAGHVPPATRSVERTVVVPSGPLSSTLSLRERGAEQAPSPRPQAHPRFSLLSLPKRVGGGSMPRVEIVDLAEERRSRPYTDHHLHALGPRLESALRATVDRGGQAILLLNRRGYASYICCADHTCGWCMQCDHCDVTVVYHKKLLPAGESRGGGRAGGGGVVRCHHCLAEQKLPLTCPRCAKRVNTFGFGTQRLEEEVERKFPSLRAGPKGTMQRLDSDTMTHAADYFEALERFRTGEARVLIGTQMIAKGLDFPGVELVGVINADTALAFPDFRASERTFQLVAQVAGRAGRSAASGHVARVIVQTFNPHEPAIRFAAAHDFAGFAELELDQRAAVGLPPAWRMARVVCRDENPVKAEGRAREVAAALANLTPSPLGRGPGRGTRQTSDARLTKTNADVAGVPPPAPSQREGELRIRGPIACPISRVAGFYRFAVELLGPTATEIQRALAMLRSAGVVKSDAHTAVDVDPVALL